MIEPIIANWSAPNNIHALTTTRQGGISKGCYQSLNLGDHVGDIPFDVYHNRQRLIQEGILPYSPHWLNQVHSIDVVDISSNLDSSIIFTADAVYSQTAKQVCAVLTADCLPILLCSALGNEVAAVHAGWRGLCYGVIEQTVSIFKCEHSQIFAWLGPAIGPKKFEVGQEVKQQFVDYDSKAIAAFTLINQTEQKYLADLYLLATQRLNNLGITQVSGGDYCTYTQQSLFFSYRRDQTTGRMASAIWFD